MSEALIAAAQDLSAIHAGQDAAIARDVGGMFRAHGVDPKFSETAHLLLPEIIDQHAQAAGLYTTHWYEALDPASKFTAKPHTEVPREQIDKMIDWALYAPGEEPPVSRMTGSSQRIVRNVSRDTITRNAADEGVLWARYAQPDACSFCRILAMRGSGRKDRKWLYSSDKSAEFRADGEKYHTHCFCEPVAVRGGQVWTPPEYSQPWDQEYKDALGRVKPGKDYLKRIASDMRSHEPKAVEPEAEPEPADERSQLRDELASASDFDSLKEVAQQLLPDTTVMLQDEQRFQNLDAGSPNLWAHKVPEVQESLKAVVRAADDVLAKYPNLQLDILQVAPEGSGAYAHAAYTRGVTQAATYRVRFDDDFIANPAVLQKSWDTGVETGFHYEGDEHPAYNITVHEMGHVMQGWAENTHGVYITADTVNQALADHFYNARPPGNRAFSAPEYEEWLRDNLSGYSTHFTERLPGRANGPGVYGSSPINAVEALAEAFADVEVNGDDAHETSQVLHALLIAAYGGVDYMEPDGGVPLPA